MVSVVNLQRNSEVFYSTVDLASGDPVSSMRPTNTWKLEVLSGFASSASASTQDITLTESGASPNRSQRRYITTVNPVDWNFQTYARVTGCTNGDLLGTSNNNTNYTGNVKPVSDWFMWQALVSNTDVAVGNSEQSVWRTGGLLRTYTTGSGQPGVHASNSNFASSQEHHLYFKLDNVIYQVANATVNRATMDADISSIVTVGWSGYGTQMIELTGTPRNNAIAVFGGILNNGITVTANANAANLTRTHSYHPYGVMNVAGSLTTSAYIKNKLTTLSISHANSATGTPNTYLIPLTAFSFSYENNINYITPEELNKRNYPIAQYMGTRAVTGSATMYLRNGANESAQLLRNIMLDSRTDSSNTASITISVGGSSRPNIALYMQAVQFDVPQIAVEDVIGVSFNYVAHENASNIGDGGEVYMDVSQTP